MLQYGSSTNSLKYASFYEFFNATGYSISPLLAGGIALISLPLNFPVLIIVLVGITAFLWIIGNNGRKAIYAKETAVN